MIKVVLDTNVIVSGFNFPKSNPGRILTLVAAGEITNFVSKPILEETKRILADSFSWTREEVEEAEFWLKTFSKAVNPKVRLTVIADEPDNRIL
jgi:putative PIN family toxin of toxin-antitoxin system